MCGIDFCSHTCCRSGGISGPGGSNTSRHAQKVQVAFRSIDQSDLLGGVSVVDMKEMSEKAYTNYSLGLIDNVVGGFNGNIWGNTEYLVVVDGMVRDANNVLPHEIDQITLLKGASAVVLYGPRAAKGVISITTKEEKLVTLTLIFMRIPVLYSQVLS